MRSLHLWLLVVVALAGCDAATPATGLPVYDDFSTPGRWTTADSQPVRITQQDGALHFFVNTPDQAAWSVAGQHLDDFALDVDATQVDGPDNNHYGVIVRYADPKNFYRLDISGDGYYSIQRFRDGEWEVLINWPESPAIRQGANTNHLRVVAQGPRLTLFVNGTEVDRIDNADIPAGDIGLTAGTFPDETGVHIAFDNLQVSSLEPPQP